MKVIVEDGNCKYIRLERSASPRSFVCKFWLPEDADASGISACCENGVFNATVKKLPPPERRSTSPSRSPMFSKLMEILFQHELSYDTNSRLNTDALPNMEILY